MISVTWDEAIDRQIRYRIQKSMETFKQGKECFSKTTVLITVRKPC